MVSRKSLRTFERRLFQLLVFLLPTQLTYHFWPLWSHVYGIRVDYLSPTLYFTDILIVALLFISLSDREFVKKVKKFYKKNKLCLFAFLLFSTINIYCSYVYEVALFGWFKVYEFMFLAVYVAFKKLNFENWIIKPMSVSLIFFSLIAFAQFYFQRTSNGTFYFLGERSFNSSTPGIALTTVFGRQLMRAYSTFPHPNSMAGYYLVGFFLLFLTDASKDSWLKIFPIIACCISLILSFSLGAWLTFIILVPLRWAKRNKTLFSSVSKAIFWSLIIVSMLTPVFSKVMLKDQYAFPENISQRLKLAEVAGDLFSQSPAVGSGLNNFITYLPRTQVKQSIFWWLQPVHNIFLLLLAETGIVGLLIAVFVLNKAFLVLLKANRQVFVLALLAILLTGTVDHYWLTLQQNQLLFAVILGLSFKRSIS